MNEQAKVFPKPVDWDELYPGRFIKASDFKGKNVTLKIAEVRLEELVGDKGPHVKGVMNFEKTEKQLALNKTNGICLKEMFGKKVQEWVGKRVTLFSSIWNGEDCVRVFGSPDIAADMEVTIALPRKRPFSMQLHKTDVAVKPVATDTDGVERYERQIRESKSKAEEKKTWTGIQAIYKGSEIPFALEVAHTEMIEKFEQ